MKQLYFAHDYDAKSDPKLQNLMMEMGLEGVGLYWCVIEDLYSEGGYLPMSMIKTLAWRYRIDEKKVDSLIRKFDLFTIDEGSFTSNSVLRRLDKVSEISEKRKKAIKKRWEKLTKEIHMNNNSNSNEIQSKEKESKEEYDEDESSSHERIDYEDFKNHYNKWATENGFPCVKVMTDARRTATKSILNEFSRDDIDKVLSICATSDFLKGANEKSWRADFDFIFKKGKFVRILEGSYDDHHCKNDEPINDDVSKKLEEWAKQT